MLWRCGVCNSQNPVGSGGICIRCRKFACNRHLSTVLGNGRKIRVCSTCLTGEDKVQNGLKDMFGKLFGKRV